MKGGSQLFLADKRRGQTSCRITAQKKKDNSLVKAQKTLSLLSGVLVRDKDLKLRSKLQKELLCPKTS